MSRITHWFANLGILNRFFTLIVIVNFCIEASFWLSGFDTNSFSMLRWLANKDDSWTPMLEALHHIKAAPSDELVYQTLLLGKGLKFQYPPSSLLFIDIFASFGLTDNQIIDLFNKLSFVILLPIALVTARILKTTLHRYGFEKRGITFTGQPLELYFTFGMLTALFYPIIWSYHVGQIQTFLTLLTTAAIWFWLKEKKQVSGILLGLICLIKPQLGILFLWALIRRQWEFVFAGALTMIPFLTLSVTLYGLGNHFDYLNALSFLSRHGESYYANQSVNGLMHRLVFNGGDFSWRDFEFPPFSRTVYITTLVSSLSFLGLGLWWNWKSKNPNAIDFSIMILSSTIASPIAWEHHYSVLLPIFTMAVPFVLYNYSDKKWPLILLTLAFIISSHFFHGPIAQLSATNFNFIQSNLFFSALAILIILYKISAKLEISPPSIDNAGAKTSPQ